VWTGFKLLGAQRLWIWERTFEFFRGQGTTGINNYQILEKNPAPCSHKFKQRPVIVCNFRSRGNQISRRAQHGREVTGAEYGSRGGAPGELQLAYDASPETQRRNGRRPSTRTVLWLLSAFGTRLNQAGCYRPKCHHLHSTARKCHIQMNTTVTQPPKHKMFVHVSVQRNRNTSPTCFHTLRGHYEEQTWQTCEVRLLTSRQMVFYTDTTTAVY
jgi:hypothetical protein